MELSQPVVINEIKINNAFINDEVSMLYGLILDYVPNEQNNSNIAKLQYSLYKLKGKAIGLAAPQIGILLRAFVYYNNKGEIITCLNPIMIGQRDSHSTEERCLSLPGYTFKVKRPKEVVLQWQDVMGGIQQEKFEGHMASVICHEYDHLKPRLISDIGSAIKKDI